MAIPKWARERQGGFPRLISRPGDGSPGRAADQFALLGASRPQTPRQGNDSPAPPMVAGSLRRPASGGTGTSCFPGQPDIAAASVPCLTEKFREQLPHSDGAFTALRALLTTNARAAATISTTSAVSITPPYKSFHTSPAGRSCEPPASGKLCHNLITVVKKYEIDFHFPMRKVRGDKAPFVLM